MLDVLTGVPDMPTRMTKVPAGAPDMLTRASDMLTRINDILTRSPDMLTRAPGMLTRSPNMLTGAPGMLAGAADILKRASESLCWDSDMPEWAFKVWIMAFKMLENGAEKLRVAFEVLNGALESPRQAPENVVKSPDEPAQLLVPMNPNPASVPLLPLEDQCYLVGNELRIGILRELAKGLPLPVGELARRVGCTPNAMSKQMALIEETRVVQQIYGRLYVMAPHHLPPAGATTLDLGQLVLKLQPPA